MTGVIDLSAARVLAERGQDLDECRMTRRWLRQAVAEIERGRWAMAQLNARVELQDMEMLDLSGTPKALGMTK